MHLAAIFLHMRIIVIGGFRLHSPYLDSSFWLQVWRGFLRRMEFMEGKKLSRNIDVTESVLWSCHSPRGTDLFTLEGSFHSRNTLGPTWKFVTQCMKTWGGLQLKWKRLKLWKQPEAAKMGISRVFHGTLPQETVKIKWVPSTSSG